MLQTRSPITLAQAEGMLQYIGGADERDTWLAVGMALRAEFGDAAFEAWNDWSAAAPNYDAKAVRASWRGFKARAGGFTIGTIIKLARDGGYRFAGVQFPVPDDAEIARRRAEHAQRVQAEQAQRAQAAARAEDRALAQWRAAARDGASAYAARKGIDSPESVRHAPDGALLVPMLRYDLPREQSLKGLQVIHPDGAKRFTPGMAKAGTACRLGLHAVGDPLFICEGWATGMSIRMAFARRYSVLVAFDAYNLPLVVDMAWRLWPQSPLVLCADDDHATLVGGLPHNTGREQARVAMDDVMEAGAKWVVRTHPLFKAQRGPKDTDFNDLHRLEGLPEVADQLGLCLYALEELQRG